MKVRIGKKIYKVDISSAKVQNRKGKAIDKDDLKKGNKVIVRGTKKINSYSVKASLVRNLSVK